MFGVAADLDRGVKLECLVIFHFRIDLSKSVSGPREKHIDAVVLTYRQKKSNHPH